MPTPSEVYHQSQTEAKNNRYKFKIQTDPILQRNINKEVSYIISNCICVYLYVYISHLNQNQN